MENRPANLASGAPAQTGQFILERRRRLVLPLLPTRCGSLVDYGCGNGAQTFVLADAADRITGVDIDEAFLAAFRAEARRLGIADRFTTAPVTAGAVPLPDAWADAVTCFTVLEHVPDEMAALAEMRRLLRPGGRLILSVPNRWWIFETHGADLPLLPWNRVPLVSWWPKRLHDRWARARIYRRHEIVEMVKRAGFSPVTSFRMTAPLDMIRWAPLRELCRKTLFRPDRAPCPVLATEIVVVADKRT